MSDELIQEKTLCIKIFWNQQIPEEDQIHLELSNGWLQRLKRRNNYKCFRPHGEKQ